MSKEPGFIVKFYDKKYEDLNIIELVNSPVESISGVSVGDAEKLKKAFNVETVFDLATHKYIKYAQVISSFSEISNELLDQEFEAKGIVELAEQPVHAIQGVSEDDATLLKEAFNIKTIKDLALNKYVIIAEMTVNLAALVELLLESGVI
jgi:hypothetical protein